MKEINMINSSNYSNTFFAIVADLLLILLLASIGIGGLWLFDFAEAQENTPPTQPRITITPDNFLFIAGKESIVVVNAYDENDDDLSYTIDFGDGSDLQQESLVPSGERTGFIHTWEEPGTYEIAVGVSDGNGGRATSTQEVQFVAEDELPPPFIGASKFQGGIQSSGPEIRVLDSVLFSFSSKDPNNESIIYTIDFGDSEIRKSSKRPQTEDVNGNTLEEPRWSYTPSKQWTDPGLYTITATVENEDGEKATSTRKIRVYEKREDVSLPGFGSFGPDQPGDVPSGGSIPGTGVVNNGFTVDVEPGQPFGGKVQSVETCSCVGQDGQEGLPFTYGKLIEVGPPREGKFLVIDGFWPGFESNIYRHYKIKLNHWVLGNSATVSLPCNKINKEKSIIGSILGQRPKIICEKKDDAPFVIHIGTGAIPASGSSIPSP